MFCKLLFVFKANLSPNSYYLKQAPFPPLEDLGDEAFDRAFAARPTVIYFHGNVRSPQLLPSCTPADLEAATRAAPHRVRTYSQLSTVLDVYVPLVPRGRL